MSRLRTRCLIFIRFGDNLRQPSSVQQSPRESRFDKSSCQEQRVRDAKWQAHCHEGHREDYQVNARHVHYSLVGCTGRFWLYRNSEKIRHPG
jgi:hypothetical protein